MNDNREIRNYQLIEIRAEEAEGKAPQITGNAAVYRSESMDLGGFVEVIEPGFFDEVLAGDTRALFNHNENYILGRTLSGTLRLIDHEGGLGFQVDPPDTATVRDLVLTPMRRGDIDQCSFAFVVKADGAVWSERPDGKWLRTLKPNGCQELLDISVVTYPAYQQTSAQVRKQFEQQAASGQEPISEPILGGARTQARDALRKQRLELLKLKVR